MERKFRRSALRRKYGNKNLRLAWGKFQRNKYGLDYFNVCIKNHKRKYGRVK